MSDIVPKSDSNLGGYTEEQMNLIKSTIAKNATDAELMLFLYRAKNLDLDPLKPGEIHFVKYGTNPGTIVVGIEGFRKKADRTGKHAGTKRGTIRDDKGKCIGAWAEVTRKDWAHPAREEVSLVEYTTGRGNWARMPETMIKKVAEAAALRIAFADDLGGVYAEEELQAVATDRESKAQDIQALLDAAQASAPVIEVPAEEAAPIVAPAEYVLKFGKNKGKKLCDIPFDTLVQICGYIQKLRDSGQTIHKDLVETEEMVDRYMAEQPLEEPDVD